MREESRNAETRAAGRRLRVVTGGGWRRPVVLGATLVIGLGIAACGGGDGGSTATSGTAASTAEGGGGATSGDPIKIGVASGQTGFMSFFDKPALVGAKMAADEINAAGGVDGRQLEVIVADHRTDVGRIGPSTLQVIEDGADVVMTSCDNDFGAPAAQEANRNGVLAVGCAGGPLFGKEGIGPLTFNVYPGTPTEGAIMAEFALSRGWKRGFALQDTSLEYSKTTCDYFKQRFTDAGGTLVGENTFKNDDPSIASQVTEIRGSDADFVAVCSYPPGGAAAVKQLREGGVKLPIVGAGAFDGTYWLKGINKLSDFYNLGHGSLWGDDPNPKRAAIFEEYEKRTGEPPASSTYTLMGYSAVQAIADGIKKSGGSTDGEELAKALETFKDEPLAVGPTTFTSDCHISVGRPMVVMQIQDGKASFVEEFKPEGVPDAPC